MMESLYAMYLKERAGFGCVEDHRGFMTYQIQGKECFIHDAFVMPAYRVAGLAGDMLAEIEQIAREAGCKMVTCTVCPAANGSTVALKTVLSLGFRLADSAPNLIAFQKEI